MFIYLEQRQFRLSFGRQYGIPVAMLIAGFIFMVLVVLMGKYHSTMAIVKVDVEDSIWVGE